MSKKKKKQKGDEAVYKADKGFGGDHDHLAKEDWTPPANDLADDEILKAQIAEDEKYND